MKNIFNAKNIIKFIGIFLAVALVATLYIIDASIPEEAEAEWQSQYAKADNYDEKLYDMNAELEQLATNDAIAENENYKLGWNQENSSVTLLTKKDGRKWGTNPNDYYKLTDAQSVEDLILSPLTVKFALNSKPTEITGEAAVNNGRIESKEIENGVSVTYYFDEYFFHITVDYYLEGDSVKVSLDPSKIVEAGENKVVSVGIAPFMCAAKNTKDGSHSSYLVIPSGSGALMYADQRSSGIGRSFSAPVYGEDKAIDKYQDGDNNSSVSMPFFGAKDGKSATLGIIESGSEYATIKAEAGEKKHGVSAVYAYVDVRGQDIVYLKGIWRNKYTEKINKVKPIVIGYYALTGDDASYYGMAKKYQDYLTQEEGLTVLSSNKLLNVKILGSYLKDELFLGLPYKQAEALTTYKQAEEILTDLKDITGGSLSATMQGFGEGGVNATKLAGNFKLKGVCGNDNDIKSFTTVVDSLGIETFFNFDVINYSQSGAGYSETGDSAINNTGIAVKTRQFLKSTRNRIAVDEGGVLGVLLQRKQLQSAVNKVVDLSAKYGISNIGFSTLGSLAYSDYTDDEYPSRKNMGADVKEMIKGVQSKNNKVLVENPFSYAAVAADVLTGCPISSNQDRAIDQDIPLYQMVFQGYRENYTTAINYAADRRVAFLKAIEAGSGISYVVMDKYDTELRKQHKNLFASSVYSDNKEYIKEYIEEGGEFLNSVADAKIKNHQILSNGLRKTEFSNGKTVYVNLTRNELVAGSVTVPALEFVVK